MREWVKEYMMEPNPFILFGSDHFWATVISLILWIFVPLYSKNSLSIRNQDKLGIALGFMVMSNYIIWVILEGVAGTFDMKLHLPFHLCRFANLAIPIVMIYKKNRLFQILYFWGMSGMIQGALTPDVTHGFPHFHFFRFFIGHNGMVLTLIYAIVVYELKPTLKGLWESFLGLNLFLVLAAIINFGLGSNYFWICEKPLTASLLDYLGPWPWYILVGEFVAILHYFAAYTPIHFMNKRTVS
ncbi:TIGR02206 family membrane protein [Candidatus Marinimicrobia bacterium]|nr:TIGR02206 family membrane protein [Candidatus Neomarinimicrobiota bacterium]